MTFEETFSPTIHRINQAIRQRAIDETSAIEKPPEVLIKWSNPPQDLVSSSATQLSQLINAAKVKKGRFIVLILSWLADQPPFSSSEG